ncbi:MAG TPA: xanthine dehydrogenase family protein subunit M [Burkholderiales bacterium]|nr:xanthine dehydrogenase family protein subunit M [Burkholderiales bacterium]
MPGIERYVVPHSLAEAMDLLRAGEATILAGGTDLMPQTQAGRLRFRPLLMNIQRIPELRGITQQAGVVRIGALTTISELVDSTLVRERLNILWQACDHFASDQIRNAATLGGNLCNASPAGDALVPLLVLEARVVLASKPNGALESRALPLAQFLIGPGRTARTSAELLVAVELPVPQAGFRGEFHKFGTRPALDIATISIGVGAVRKGATLHDVRVAFGAVAPTPLRAPRTEAALEGRAPDDGVIEAALRAADAEIQPIDDVRASEWYRRELVHNILRRVIARVSER